MEKIILEYSYDGAVANIILNNGKGNILDAGMMSELLTVFERFKNENSLKLITFEGAGKHFSFGASVEEHVKDNCGKMLKSFHQLFYDLIALSIPTMAKITGQCLGGGMELAIFCNFMFADSTVMLGQPEIELGVFAPPASAILPLKLGAAKADETLLTGKIIDAQKAKDYGLLNDVFEDKDAMNSALDEWIKSNIIKKSASSLKFANKAARMGFNETLLERLPKLEKLYVEGLMESFDANEGIASFLEKRRPEWKNC